MTDSIPASAERFAQYLRRMAALPAGVTYLYVSLGKCLAILDEARHIALVELNGQPVPVSYGAGVPAVGSHYPVYQTREGERWLKVLAKPWRKVWQYSDAHSVASHGYPYANPRIGFLFTPVMSSCVLRKYAVNLGRPELVKIGLAEPAIEEYPEQHPTLPYWSLLCVWQIGISAGIPFFHHGTPAEYPQVPAVPAGAAEFGRLYIRPLTEVPDDDVVYGEAESDSAHHSYLALDRRKDPIQQDLFLTQSFNQTGTQWLGEMEIPSVFNQLNLYPVGLFGSGQDGAATVPANTTVDLTQTGPNGSGSPSIIIGRILAITNNNDGTWDFGPTGLASGDSVAIYIPSSGHFMVIHKILVSNGRLTVPASDFSVEKVTDALDSDKAVFVQRVPQFTSLTINSGAVLTAKSYVDGGTGLICIKAWSISGAGKISMDGAGFPGGASNVDSLPCGPFDNGRVPAGMGHDELADTDGVGVAGGGSGGNLELCSATGSAIGSGGSGGGGHADYGEAGEDGANTTVITNLGGAGGEPMPDALNLVTSSATLSIGTMFLGGGGGAGIGTGHTVPPGKGGDGGGVVALFARTAQITITANGAAGHLSGAALARGAGGGAGGAVYVATETGTGLNIQAIGQAGGIRWTDAFHRDGRGGNGAVGRIHILYNTLNGGSFGPSPYLQTPITYDTTGEWISEPVDLSRVGLVRTFRADWAKTVLDNPPPKFRIYGAKDVRFETGVVAYGPWVEDDPSLPIVSGIKTVVSDTVVAARRFWRVGVFLDTGGSISDIIADSPVVTYLELAGVA